MSEMRRYAKGARPQFYSNVEIDEAMSMIMVLASEVCVLRDRLDTVERLGADGVSPSSQAIDQFEPDESCLSEREQARQDFFERLFFVAQKRAQEVAEKDDAGRYKDLLDEIGS